MPLEQLRRSQLMHLGTSDAKPQTTTGYEGGSSRNKELLGNTWASVCNETARRASTAWAAFYCRNADPGWSFCPEHQVPTSQHDHQNHQVLQQEEFSMQHCCAGTDFHTALVSASVVFTRDQVLPRAIHSPELRIK